MPLAIAYARYISCTNRDETDACGVCPSCVKFNKLVHPDVHFVFPIVKSSKGKREVCDDYIADWWHVASWPAAEARYQSLFESNN